VVTLLCIFVMATTQLTSKWVEQTRVTEAQGIIERAIGQTKALAIRNPQGVFGGAVAALCVTNDTIEIKSIAAGAAAVNCATAATGTKIWSAKLPSGISIKKDKDAVAAASCLALLDHKARYSPDENCVNSSTLTLAIKEHDEPHIFN
jgi:hypothetical protein